MTSVNEKVERSVEFYIPELDGLRFFSFILVFLHHHLYFANLPFFGILHSYGWIGVNFFFSISAFLFTKLLIAEYHSVHKIDIKKFFYRRILRICPLYFVIVCLSLIYVLYGSIDIDKTSLRVLGLLTFTDNLLAAKYGFNPLPFVAHLWTISFEVQFYLIIPFVIVFLIRLSHSIRLILGIGVLIILNLIRIIFISGELIHPASWVLPFINFDSLIFGVCLGFGGLCGYRVKISPELIGLIGIFCFMLVTGLPYFEIGAIWPSVYFSLVGLATTSILYAVFNSNHLKKIFSLGIFIYLGKRSYGLYVYHLLGSGLASFMIVKIKLIPNEPFALAILSFTITALLAILSYKFLESPFLKRKNKYGVIDSRPI